MAKAVNIIYTVLALTAVNSVKADPCSSITGSGTKFIVSPKSCQLWIACANGKTVNSGECPNGKYFDNKSSTCLPSSQVNCIIADACKGVSDGKYVTNPVDCNSYFYCKGNIGYAGFCKPDWIFDAKTGFCTYMPNYKCPAIGTGPGGGANENPCLNVPNGIFLASSQSCSEYILCQNGKEMPGKCNEDYLFNPKTQACDHADNVECKIEGALSIVPDAEEICKGVTTTGEFKPDPGSCEGYYYCKPNTKPLEMVHGVCPDGLYFDSPNCAKPDPAKCKLTACYGKPIGYFDKDSTSCKKYNYCSNTGAKPGECPTGYYFDVANQNCNSPSVVECSIEDDSASS